MKTAPLLSGALAVLLAAAPGTALAWNNAGYAGASRYGRSGPPVGMTGHYRGWTPGRGSGSGANNFVGNGRGHWLPGRHPEEHFGGWFADNHNGSRR